MLSIFETTVDESYEMLYQSENEYYFDSTKFSEYFRYEPKACSEGIHDTIVYLKTIN